MTELKGKQLSLQAKLCAVGFVVVAAVLSWIFRWPVETWHIIQVGLFIAFVFGPVDISLIAEKFGRH